MLNSAPIAPKNEATLKCLRKLHPSGEDPAPIPHHNTPHFNEDVVRKSLCTFGPGSWLVWLQTTLVTAVCACRDSFVHRRFDVCCGSLCERAQVFCRRSLQNQLLLCGLWPAVILLGASWRNVSAWPEKKKSVQHSRAGTLESGVKEEWKSSHTLYATHSKSTHTPIWHY